MKYTRLFPKVAIYINANPKYIPAIGGTSAEGYSQHEQMEIGEILYDLKIQNGGILPQIVTIGSYAKSDGKCIIKFRNKGKYSPEWFEKNQYRSK